MKKIFLLAFAAAAVLGISCCTPGFKSFEGDPLDTKMYTLDNGLKVFMTVNKDTPRIQTYIAVRAGGKNGPDESTGLAHYFEHLMFKGTQQFGTSDYAAEKPLLDEIEQLFEQYRATCGEAERSAIYHRIDSLSYEASKIAIPNEYDKLMASIGADGTNAWTSMDETVYTEDIPSNQIENWARIQADRFQNVVLRGFHTELETIYEEKNMSLTQDSRKIWEALGAGLFPHHPYGMRTVLGTQEHLKNPSITNVKNFHDAYYVPNNVAICLSGDFDPKEMVGIIEKYFGQWQPNKNVPTLEYEEETPIIEPVVKDVYGLESEKVAIGWRTPKASDLRNAAIAQIAGSVLYNGNAGLMDLDIIQQQKALSAYAASDVMADYGEFVLLGSPKQGQSLEEVRDILLAEVEKMRKGEFDESLIESTVNNFKLSLMNMLESNSARAQLYVTAFIGGIDWADACREMERYEAVTKEDVVRFANEFLSPDSYVLVNKRQGEDKTVKKISAPSITPIESNRDNASAFLREIQGSDVTPIEPVFVDFSREMEQFNLSEGTNVLYKKNEKNDIFQLTFTFNRGTDDEPELSIAPDYLSYLGTDKMTAEEIAVKFYSLACNFSINASAYRTTVSISGLSENMAEALTLVEDLVFNARADEKILDGIKSDILKSRENSKKSQRSCFSALTRYLVYGPEYVKKTTMSNDRVAAVSSDELIGKVKDLYNYGHEILYYGPASSDQLKDILARNHRFNAQAPALAEKFVKRRLVDQSKVYLTQYDAKQLYYYQYSNRGETFQSSQEALSELYNEYFGGGMNAIVFQEMREARGLAYSAGAALPSPSFADDNYYFIAQIATQNDKLRIAAEAFDEIINDMPQSQAAFKVAKEAVISRMRTNRTIGTGVLYSFVQCRRLGLDKPLDEQIFNTIQTLELEDIKAFQEKWVKGRTYSYGILGDIKDLDTDFLKTLGPVTELSREEIFGY